MKMYIHPELNSEKEKFKLPEKLGFGNVMAPVMFRIDYENGNWKTGQLLPYAPISLDPAAKAFHYAQILFEGLKAYKVKTSSPVLFRPEVNWERLNKSAQRMLMPDLPLEIFMQALFSVTAFCEDLIPDKSQHSLYLRPFMIGTQPSLSLSTSDTFSFFVIASPSEPFNTNTLKVFLERDNSRAAKGGTGEVKVSGNYGAALYSTAAAIDKGYDLPLWLDSVEHRFIEELSVMNFFGLIDNEIHTPKLTDSILPGVTRDSIIHIAKKDGIIVHERAMDIDELLASISSGNCTELFACGTAAIVVPISVLGDKDSQEYVLPTTKESMALRLRDKLLDIQEGRIDDKFAWLSPVSSDG
jgi:branched-chain amino acid aminotransferase